MDSRWVYKGRSLAGHSRYQFLDYFKVISANNNRAAYFKLSSEDPIAHDSNPPLPIEPIIPGMWYILNSPSTSEYLEYLVKVQNIIGFL